MTETPPEAQPSDAAGGAGPRGPVREPEDRRLAGVCAGLADHLGVDVTALRVTAVILALLTPLAVLAYAVAALALPERDPQEPRRRHGSPRALPHPLLAVGVLVAAAALAPRAWWLDPFPAAVALIGIGVWLIAENRPHTVTVPQHSNAHGDESTTVTGHTPVAGPVGSTQGPVGVPPSGESPPPASPRWSDAPGPPPAPAPPGGAPPGGRLDGIVVALLVFGAGALWSAHGLGIATVAPSDALALGLVAVGAALVVAAWRGRAFGLVPVGLLLAGTLAVADVIDVPLDAGLGERTVVVRSASDLGQRHELLAGDLTIDLTGAPLRRTRPTRLEATVGAGRLRVLVPAAARVDVHATVGLGDIDAPRRDGGDATGVAVDETFTLGDEPGAPRLALDLSMGVGEVEVDIRA